MIGETILHYRVLEKIGQGGMGIVYKAEDIRLGRLVALKFLCTPARRQPDGTSPPPPATPRDPVALERFHREARAMSSLNHPNICTAYDVGEYQGQPFIAMEHLDGETLKTRLAGDLGFAPFRADEVLDFAIQIAAGLEVAHQHDIVHRDIKPANIFMTKLGQAKLLDFGLARLTRRTRTPALVVAGNHEGESFRPDSWSGDGGGEDPTLAGTTLGTLFYMSPEQQRGEELDARTDIFSFGLVLSEMTAAWQSFQGKVADARKGANPRDTASDAEILRGLDAITAGALKEDRNERYQTATAMKLDLMRLKDTSQALRILPRPEIRPAFRLRAKHLVAGVVALAVVAAGFFYFDVSRSHAPSPRSSIVLADFVNSTGDSVFTNTLQQGLGVTLSQSPLVNILSEDSVHATLRLMERPSGTSLTADVAREVCQRAGSAAYVTGSIASLGRQYVVQVKATGCRDGDTLAMGQATAASKEQVLDALGKAATGLRRKLGESLASVKKFDVPMGQATSGSLEALKFFTLGLQAYSQKGLAAALPLFHRATELDPNFALVYEDLGLVYDNAGQSALATENLRKAYALRARVSERECLYIEAHYARAVTGDLEKARESYELWTATYPGDPTAHGGLAVALSMSGQYARALEENNEARSLEPLNRTWAANAVNFEMALDRLKEAGDAYHQALGQKLDSDYLHSLAYSLAFLNQDAPGMIQQSGWAKGRSGTEDVILAAEADTQAYAGHLARARDLSQQATESAAQAEEEEVAAGWQALSALREALFGEAAEARRESAAALARSSGRDVVAAAGLALALAGDSAGSSRVADDLARRFPQDTVVNFNYVPAIRAAAAAAGLAGTSAQAPAKAIDQLRPAIPSELGIPTVSSMSLNLYPAYVRGLAYLRLGQGPEAAVEFQKIIHHPGIVVNEPVGALARLNLARALSQSGDNIRGRQAYRDFLDLWKDGDPGIPVLDQARAESARLQ
jgi:serine/threonine protein kinase/Flp pilus assembly protein TadD